MLDGDRWHGAALPHEDEAEGLGGGVRRVYGVLALVPGEKDTEIGRQLILNSNFVSSAFVADRRRLFLDLILEIAEIF